MSIEVSIRKKFNGFSLDVGFNNENQRMGILGASGSGKSMILKCIAGIEKPDSGRIILNGRILFDSEKNINLSPMQRRVGYLFQDYALFPTMTVEENIGVAMKQKREIKRQIIVEKMKEFRLEGLEKRYPSELSGGQQQRVALARMLSCNPKMIMLDEPFSALDSYLKEILQEQLIELLKDYQGDIILVSHNRDETYRICEKLVVIKDGRTVIAGNKKEIYENPVNSEAAKLTGCKNISKIYKIDDNTIEAIQWGIILKFNTAISKNINCIGIRAHDFIPMWEKPEKNFIPFVLAGKSSLPFEELFYVKTWKGGSAEDHICWSVHNDKMEEINKKGNPLYLYIREENVLLLE